MGVLMNPVTKSYFLHTIPYLISVEEENPEISESSESSTKILVGYFRHSLWGTFTGLTTRTTIFPFLGACVKSEHPKRFFSKKSKNRKNPKKSKKSKKSKKNEKIEKSKKSKKTKKPKKSKKSKKVP